MKRASTSLPVPDSPEISTVQSLAATRRARSASRRELSAMATISSADESDERWSSTEASASCSGLTSSNSVCDTALIRTDLYLPLQREQVLFQRRDRRDLPANPVEPVTPARVCRGNRNH